MNRLLPSPLDLVRVSTALDSLRLYHEADLVDGVLLRLAADGPRGEYWLRDGRAEYADGDVGDVNHGMIAEQQLLGDLGYDLSEDPQSLEDANYAFNSHVDGNVQGYGWPQFAQDAEAQHGENWAYQVTLEDYLKHQALSTAAPEAKEAKSKWFEEQHKGFTNPRMHAIKNWGWQGLRGNDVELWDLSPRAVENLARGLEDAFDSEGLGDEGEYGEEAESPLDGVTFNVEVHSLGRMLYGVPFHEIADGSIVKRIPGFVQQQAPVSQRRVPSPTYNSQGD